MSVRRRRILAAVAAGVALVAVSSASGVDIDGYTATGTPTHVRPSTQTTFTIALTNKPASPREADRAKIAIPPGFTVANVQPSASAAGACVASTWVADGTLIAGGKINLKTPGGSGGTNRLCPGATLTVQFLATSSAVEGTYTWATELLRGEDKFVLTGAQPSVQVDGTPPTITISSQPPNPSNDPAPSFAFSAGEAVGFECKLDGGSFTSCSSPKTYSGLLGGSHAFTVRATDAAGNVATSSYSWLIDTTPPVVVLTDKPNLASKNSTANFSFTTSESAAFDCKLDDGPLVECASPKSYGDLADGSHTFTVRALDLAGNSGQTSFNWTIDTVAPSVTLTQKPNDPSGVNSATFAFVTAAPEPATFQCRLDTLVFTSCTSPKSYNGLSDGAHTFAVRATDAAGNTSEESEASIHSWLVETVRPVVTLTDSPKNPSNSSAAAFAFAANKAATFQCQLDAATYVACDTPRNYAGLADGAHTFRVKATGTAGTGPETVYTWTIDTSGPTIAITGKPADPTNNHSASFAFAASEPSSFQCKLDGGAFAACSPPQAYGNLGEGRHTFVVRAIDALTNVGPETAYAWTIETRAPLTTITSAPRGLGNSTIAALSFSADEPATFQCKLDDGGFDPCSSPASYAGLRDGGHAFVVRAIDSAGNAGVASHGWTVDATAPQTTIDSRPARSTTATSATFAFSSSEPATFQCRLDGGAFAPCGAPRTYKALARSVHTFAVRAIDSAGNVDATPAVSTWTVGRPVTRTVAKYALFAPTRGARVTRPPLLRWRTVSRAKYYNVQLYRAGRKVLTAWPTRPSLQLQARWTYGGRAERFKAGVYRWYVWPGFGRASDRRYGRLLGTSTFVVGRTTRQR